MTKRIIWEKFQPSDEDDEYEFLEEDDDEEFSEEPEDIIKTKVMSLPKVIQTQFGLHRIDDKMAPWNQFNLWIGHTNFTIDHEIAKQIEDLPGVEILKIISPLRFMIGIGKLFLENDVKTEFNKQICGVDDDSRLDVKTSWEITKLRNQLKKDKEWMILVLPNGRLIHTSCSDDDYKDKTRLFRRTSSLTGSILITK